MLALLIYCYANGIFSSRRIERATHRDIGVRFVAANLHPDHDTIAPFRRENFAAVSESFLQVLLLAREFKLLRVGLVSVDGSRFKANASKHRSVRWRTRRSRVWNNIPLACRSSVFTATKRVVGRCAVSQHAPDYDPGIASASAMSFLCRFTNGLT